MKRLLYAILAAILIATWAPSAPPRAVAADDSLVIDLTIESVREDDTRSEGEACHWSLPFESVRFASLQVIVRDDTGSIVAVTDLENGTIRPAGGSEGFKVCTLDLAIEVPDRAFYTVSVAAFAETRIVTYSREQLPIEEAFVMVIDPESLPFSLGERAESTSPLAIASSSWERGHS